MGFSSVECHGCHKSILAPYRLPAVMVWMNHATVVTTAGDLIQGTYDGYGGIDGDDGQHHGRDLETGEGVSPLGDQVDNWSKAESTAWHTACWRVAGEPREHRGPSLVAADQGFFFDETEYMIPEPKVSK